MRRSRLIILAAALVAACATYIPSSSPLVTHWQERDISELISAVGPYDTTSIKGDWRSYDWFRFGNCHLAARTSLEGRIQKIELEGMGMGCDVYIRKLGAS